MDQDQRPGVCRVLLAGRYGAFSLGQSQVPSVRAYLAKQKLHHQQVTFEAELIELLQKYSVEYDERYLWS